MNPSDAMDRRDGWIWLDGALHSWRDSHFHVLSHGLHYASSVFEGERCYGGRVFRIADHGRRLLRSCDVMDLACPYDAAALDRAVTEVIEANWLPLSDRSAHPKAHGRLRLTRAERRLNSAEPMAGICHGGNG